MSSSLAAIDRIPHIGLHSIDETDYSITNINSSGKDFEPCHAEFLFRTPQIIPSDHDQTADCSYRPNASQKFQSNDSRKATIVSSSTRKKIESAWKSLLDFERLASSSPSFHSNSLLNPQLIQTITQARAVTACSSEYIPNDADKPPTTKNSFNISIRNVALALFFGGVGAFLHVIFSTLPPDFLDRWKKLVSEQPHHDPKTKPESKGGTTLYDCHGTVIATVVPGGFSGKKDPEKPQAPLKPNEIPSAMWQAVIASEDRRFFEHSGVDPRGVSRAVLSLARTGGGSTITQQLVKNVFLTNERKWTRKFMEIILAIILEKQMSKWDILHLYLNKIYWGHGVNGIEAASALYFGKHPSNLTLGECSMLAGIIPAPELLSPYRDPSRGRKPQARALRRMVEAGFLDIATANAAIQEPLQLGVEGKEGKSGPWRAPYFVSEVLHELSRKYGMEEILQGGLQVYTTLDLNMQDAAEKVVKEGTVEYDRERMLLAQKGLNKNRIKLNESIKDRESHLLASMMVATQRKVSAEGGEYGKNGKEGDLGLTEATSMALIREETRLSKLAQEREKIYRLAVMKYEEELRVASDARLEGAMVAMDPSSGAVRVLVGGRDYYESNFNRATQALRPPGSTFKPVVYLTALAEGIERNHVLIDEPYEVAGFAPENYDRKFRGQVTLEESLLRSLNVPTVKLCAEIGVDKVCRMGRLLGIKSPLPHELALSLGGCEVTPLQLTTVYSTIASGGIYNKPHIITRVESNDGTVLEEVNPHMERKEPVVDEYSVSELRKLLQAVVERGTGKAARFNRPCAGKTGTSDGHRDVWFAGFTPQLSCVVWLGYDDNLPVGGMHPGTGASHAAPLWKRFMAAIHEGLPVKKFNDVGKDKHGSKAPKTFEKKSRRVQKAYLRDGFRKSNRWMDRPLQTWKDVWDWEKASSAWEEKEKMDEWSRARKKRTEEIKALRAIWQPKPTNAISTTHANTDVSLLSDSEKGKFFVEGKEESSSDAFFAAEIAAQAKWGNDEYEGVWEEGFYINKKNQNQYYSNYNSNNSNGGHNNIYNNSNYANNYQGGDVYTSNSFPPSSVVSSSFPSASSSRTAYENSTSINQESRKGQGLNNAEIASESIDDYDLEMGDPCILIRGNIKSTGLFARGKYMPNQPLPYCAERPSLPKISRRRAGVDWTEKEKDGREKVGMTRATFGINGGVYDGFDGMGRERYGDVNPLSERGYMAERGEKGEGYPTFSQSYSSSPAEFEPRNAFSDADMEFGVRKEREREKGGKKGWREEKKSRGLLKLMMKREKKEGGQSLGNFSEPSIPDEREFASTPLYKADGNMTSEVSGLLPHEDGSGMLGVFQSGLSSFTKSLKSDFRKG